MRTLVDTVPGAHAPLQLVLLSGTYSVPEDFVREGFVSAVRERGIGSDIVMAEVRMAYFAEGTVVERIRESVMEPARGRGAQRIWVAGISLGALSALAYAARHPGEIEGMLLLSPYPGTRIIQREIDAAGGLARWHPALGDASDPEREAWDWIARRPADAPTVHCYFGSGDRFAAGQRKMAEALDPAHTREVAGGHEWKDWRWMWNDFLDRKVLR